MPRKKTVHFEDSLQELESLVDRMESGDLSLEESLQAFEQGVGLTRLCQQSLQSAEQKVQILLKEGSEMQLSDFNQQTP